MIYGMSGTQVQHKLFYAGQLHFHKKNTFISTAAVICVQYNEVLISESILCI